jgi:hypothetical protein
MCWLKLCFILLWRGMNYFHSDPSHSKKSSQQISILRALLLVSIALTGILSGGLSYYFIRKYQVTLYEEHFNGIAQDHFKEVKKSFQLQLQANLLLSTAMGWSCPSASDWPNCAVSSRELLSLTNSLLNMSQMSMYSISPIVHPENRKSFEEFALEYYRTDGGYPNGTGISDFGSEIFDYDASYNRIRSPNHTDPTKSKYDILVPVLYTSAPSLNYFLANSYTDPILKPTIDDILDCLNQSSQFHPSTPCSAISNFLPSEMSKFSSIGTPIFPANSADTVVGIIGSLFSWETLLSTTAKQDFNLQCSIQSSSHPLVRSYTIRNGIAQESNGITHLPVSEDHFWHQSKKSFLLDPEGILPSETTYTVTYFSSNDAPSVCYAAVACMCCIAITLLISITFTFFNILISRAALETSMLLDSKRTYVRFVSHEIR